MKTSSSLVTPSPTWSTSTVTLSASATTKSPSASPAAAFPAAVIDTAPQPSFPSLWPQHQSTPRRHVDPVYGLEHADVLEIGSGTSQLDAKEKLDRLKQAYGIFFAQQQQQQGRFGLRQQAENPNPIFAKDDDFEYLEGGYDQQVLAAQARPVFVNHPNSQQQQKQQLAPQIVATPVQETKEPVVEIRTVYMSGRVPGEYTTSLTTVTITPTDEGSSSVRTPRRARREVIAPTRVTIIDRTVGPGADPGSDDILDELLSSLQGLEEEDGVVLQSSQAAETVTVTVTACHMP